MPDRHRRKRVRMMRRVLREHGSPVPKKGCLGTFLVLAFFLVAVVVFTAMAAIGMSAGPVGGR